MIVRRNSWPVAPKWNPEPICSRCNTWYFHCSVISVPLTPSSGGEYWMIYRWLSYLAFVRFGSSPITFPHPSPCQQVVSFSQSSFVSPVELTDGRGGEEEGVGEKPNQSIRPREIIQYSLPSGIYSPPHFNSSFAEKSPNNELTRHADGQNILKLICQTVYYTHRTEADFWKKLRALNTFYNIRTFYTRSPPHSAPRYI